MSALAWWLIPIGATVLAIAFVMLRSRPGKPNPQRRDGHLQRMAEAMERPMPDDARPPPRKAPDQLP